ALWDKVVVMGREVCPEHPLFGGGEPAHVQVNEYADLPVFTESNLEPATSPATQANFAETDSDMNFWETENTPTVSNSIEFESALPEDVASHTSEQISPVSEHEFSEALSSYDLVATPHELEIEASTPEATAAELEYNEPASDHNLDYKFDFDLEKQADFLAKANAQLVMPEADQFSGLEVDSGLLGNSDEVGTKLELARAYIEMSDPEGAQSILDEVMKEGDENQRQEAQALLLKVG
ncbi:MAG: FimV/HubP family polar landmark protein, partial [Gammaproteobacteria bacterium]